jgi:hypothetical protein
MFKGKDKQNLQKVEAGDTTSLTSHHWPEEWIAGVVRDFGTVGLCVGITY